MPALDLASSANGSTVRRTRADALRDAIADLILTGEFAPGLHLDEQFLADRFHVSRTPVREALKQLAASDLVEMRAHRGALVADLAPERMAELFEALAETEAVCARLAAIKMTGFERGELDRLHAACQHSADGGDIEAYHRANLEFHTAIYSGSHNGFMTDSALGLRRRLSPFSRAQFRTTGRPGDSAREHDAIVAAIRLRDGAAAEEAMRRHITTVGRAYAAYAAEQGPKVPAEA